MVSILLATLLFSLLQCLDWYSTRTIIKNGGYEQNPVMAYLFKKFNMDIVLFIKTIVLSLLGYLLAITPLQIKIKEIVIDFIIYYKLILNIDFLIPTPLALVPLIVLYLWVVIHNWKSL
jgi:hypothetical protein